jgi:hypothetical protein
MEARPLGRWIYHCFWKKMCYPRLLKTGQRQERSTTAALALATPGPAFFAYEEGRCAGHQAVLVRVVRQSLQNFNFISKVLQPYFSQ